MSDFIAVGDEDGEHGRENESVLKVAHLCLSCFYIDGYGYQENELVRQHLADGHDVFVIASTENYGPDGKITYVEPSTYVGSEGAPVTRLAYRKVLPHALMKKAANALWRV